MYEFASVAGDEEWPFYDYATSPEARAALQGEGVEVGSAVIQPRPGGALVTFDSFTGPVVQEKTKVYAFRLLVADAAGNESSLVIFCKYDGTPPELKGSASAELLPAAPEDGEPPTGSAASNPGFLVRGTKLVWVGVSESIYSYTVDGTGGALYDYGKLYMNKHIPVGLSSPEAEFTASLTDLFGNVNESSITVSVDTKGLVSTWALGVLDAELEKLPIERYDPPYGEVFPLMVDDGLAVEVHRVGYRQIPDTDPPRYEWTGTTPDHIASGPPAAGVPGMWQLVVMQVLNFPPASAWLEGPGRFEEVLLLAFGEPDLGPENVAGLSHPLVEVDGLAGRGRPVEFGCVVGGPGRIVHQGVGMGDQFFVRRDKWLWFKDGEQEWQDLPTGCFVDESPFDNTSEDQASWLAAHGPTFSADPAKCEGVLLNLAGEVTLPGGAHARVNRPGRRPLAVDLTTTYYDAAGFLAEAPYKVILVEAWPHYVPAAPTTVYIRGWYGEEFDEGDEIDTSNIVFEKDGVQISPTTAEIVYDDPANRSIVQAIRCEVDFTEPEGEDYTGFWDVLVKCGEVQGPSSFFLLSCAAKVISMDIEVYNGQGATSPVPDADEVSVGAFTVANLNNTDGDTKADGTPIVDKDDADVTATPAGRNEVDLMQLILRKPEPDVGGSVRVRIASGAAKLYKSDDKTAGEVGEDELEQPVSDITTDHDKDGKPDIRWWVEATGYSRTTPRTISVRYDFQRAVGRPWIEGDEVRATGVWAEMTKAIHNKGDTYTIWPDITTPPKDRLDYFGGHIGLRPIDSKGVRNIIAMQFTVYPPGIGGEPGVRFDLTRRKHERHWYQTGTQPIWWGHVPWPPKADGANDDPNVDDESASPTDQDHMYSEDVPGVKTDVRYADWFIMRANFQEFLRVGFGGVKPSGNTLQGSRCSKYFDWHVRHKVIPDGTKWKRSTDDHPETDENDVGPDHRPVGTTP